MHPRRFNITPFSKGPFKKRKGELVFQAILIFHGFLGWHRRGYLENSYESISREHHSKFVKAEAGIFAFPPMVFWGVKPLCFLLFSMFGKPLKNNHTYICPKTMKNTGFGGLKTRLFTNKTSENVGFGGPWLFDSSKISSHLMFPFPWTPVFQWTLEKYGHISSTDCSGACKRW